MAILEVLTTDNFEIWRQKTNLIAAGAGDLGTLNSDILDAISPDEDIISAINYIYTDVTRQVLIKSIAMA